MKPWHFVLQTIVMVALIPLSFVLHDSYFKPAPPVNPVAAAAASYAKTLPAAYHNEADQVRNGKVTTLADLLKGLQAHAKPLADAQDTAIKQFVGTDGKVTNPVGLADMLDTVSKALEAK